MANPKQATTVAAPLTTVGELNPVIAQEVAELTAAEKIASVFSEPVFKFPARLAVSKRNKNVSMCAHIIVTLAGVFNLDLPVWLTVSQSDDGFVDQDFNIGLPRGIDLNDQIPGLREAYDDWRERLMCEDGPFDKFYYKGKPATLATLSEPGRLRKRIKVETKTAGKAAA